MKMNGRSEIPGDTSLECGRKGYFVTRTSALVMAVVYLGSLILLGVLMFFIIPCATSSSSSNSLVQDMNSEPIGNIRQTSTIVTTPKPVRANSRLPTHIHPTHYRIDLIPFIMEGNFTTHGEVWITLECHQAANNITLNINNIKIAEDDVELLHLPNTTLQVIAHDYDTEVQTYSIILEENLLPGEKYQLYIRYTGQITDNLQGFYRSSYFVDPKTKQRRWLASTQFSPTDARRAFPCFDEPAFKARFSVSLARPSHLTSLSNMPIGRTEQMADIPGWEWDHYNQTVPMSTYLVAFIISDLKSLEAQRDDTTTGSDFRFRVWSRESALQSTKYAARIGPRILHYLETYFNIPFPLPKQDMVALPDFGFGGMENWGLITFRESSLLYDQNSSTELNKWRVAEVVSHELSHQWFGNLVTPLWWNDLWLKEGFATFIGYMAMQEVEPKWRAVDLFIHHKLQDVFTLDALKSSHPISVPVEDTDQIREIFDRVSYAKGASVIRMMYHFLGDETFKQGLTNYLEAHKYGNARQDDLWQKLTIQAHLDGSLPAHMTVKQIMDTWTLQTGYPVVTVTRNYADNTARVTQERFLLSGDNSNVTWWIPITYTTQDDPDFNTTRPQLWLENVESTVVEGLPKNESWVLFNVYETGFYIVNYDDTNWKLLISSFHELSDVTRAQLLNGALNLALSGRLDYQIALELTSQIMSDTEYLPWSAAFSAFGNLDTMLALTPAYGNFKKFVLGLLDKVYNNLDFEDRVTDSHLDLIHRRKVLIWACKLDHEVCVWHAKNKFLHWMAGRQDASPISPNQKEVVYCTAIKYSGVDAWDFAWKKYLSSNVGSEKEQLLEALGCSREPWILNRYLSWIISNTSGILKQDGVRVFASVANNGVGHSLAFNFLRDNWDTIQSYYGVAFSSISRMVTSASTYMNTPLQLAQLTKLRDENAHQLGTTTQSFQQAIEVVQANVKWMDNSYTVVRDWLKAYSRLRYY